MSIVESLENKLPEARLAILRAIANIAQQNNLPLYIVGGVVRDLLLSHTELDLDLVVEGDAIGLGNTLVKKYGGSLTTHQRFGTAKWHIAEQKENLANKLDLNTANTQDLPDSIDLISARSEMYQSPTDLPTVKFSTINDDLHRRDFTINTLAIRLDGDYYGELIDLLEGQADMKNKLIRVIHDLSFQDDPTRIFRAVRFEQRLGYQIEDQTLIWLTAALPWIEKVSGDRLRHELDAIFQEEKFPQMLARLADLGVLNAISPTLKWNQSIQQDLFLARQANPNPDWNLEDKLDGYSLQTALMYISWFIALPKTEVAHLMGRLMFPGWLTKMVLRACDNCDQEEVLKTGKPSQIADRLKIIPSLTLYAHYLNTKNEKVKESLRCYLEDWRHVKPITNGHDLQQRGLAPGPRYSEILDTLRDAWIDEEVSSKEEEQALLKRLLND